MHNSALSKPISILMMSKPDVDLFFWWTPRISAHSVCSRKHKLTHAGSVRQSLLGSENCHHQCRNLNLMVFGFLKVWYPRSLRVNFNTINPIGCDQKFICTFSFPPTSKQKTRPPKANRKYLTKGNWHQQKNFTGFTYSFFLIFYQSL